MALTYENNHRYQPNVNQLQLLTLNVGHSEPDSNWNWKNVHSPFSRLFYVTKGTAQLQLPPVFLTDKPLEEKEMSKENRESRIINLRPGYMYFIPAFTTHSYICNTVFHLYYVHIYEDLQTKTSFLDEWELPTEVEADNGDELLIRKLCDINPFLRLPQSNPDSYDNHQTLVRNLNLNQRRPFCDKVESRGILYILMARFLKHATPKDNTHDDRIRQTLTYIRQHIHEPMDIRLLADKAFMSKDHFIRIFRQEMGTTPNVYIRQKKMENAEVSLVTSNLSVKTIANSLGYDDCSYFVRIFKRTTGVTPQQYRENT